MGDKAKINTNSSESKACISIKLKLTDKQLSFLFLGSDKNNFFFMLLCHYCSPELKKKNNNSRNQGAMLPDLKQKLKEASMLTSFHV